MKFAFALLCFILGFVSPSLAATHEPRTVTVAAITLSKPSHSNLHVQNAITALEKAFVDKGYSFDVIQATTDELGKLAQANSVDLFVASGGLYRSLIPYGARDIATLFDPRSSSPNRGIGSNFVVLKTRTDIRGIKDLKGKTVTASFPNAFTGNAYAMGEVAQRGYDPQHFFRQILYRFPVSDIVDSIVSGRADAGVIVTCILEEMRAVGDKRADLLKVLEPRQDDQLACEHTSALYPSWTFATTPRADSEISTIATSTLLDLAPDSKGWKWSIATDFGPTDQLLKTLKMGPYSVLRQWTFQGIFKRYYGEILLCLFALVLLISHAFIVTLLVKKRTQDLSDALNREKVLSREKSEINARLENMQRAGAVGQMGSMLAHELKQPLTAMRYSCRGIMKLLEDETTDKSKLLHAADTVYREAIRADKIVDRVRAYAKHRSSKAHINVSDIARLALENFTKSGRNSVVISYRPSPNPLWVFADPLEVELAIINLLKNAADACKNVKQPKIEMTCAKSDLYAAIKVTDNGPRIDDKTLAELQEPLFTKKSDGLGLGLAIVTSIAQNAGGRLVFERNTKKSDGLTALLLLKLNDPYG